jgi:hypothetical protein
MSDFCSGCGTEHHWLDCPEVVQSVFDGEDPETAREEYADLISDLHTETDPDMIRRMLQRAYELFPVVYGDPDGTPVAPPWDPRGTPVAPDQTGAVS